MRSLTFSAGILLMLGTSAFAQSYEMTIHLKGGATITIPNDDIRRIEFANVPTGTDGPDDLGQAPHLFQLLQNYPNPFNPSTTITYEIPNAADVTVRIFDVKGALIRVLLHEAQSAGRHEVPWNGTDSRGARVPSGVYIYAVECGDQDLARRLILVK